MAGSWQLFLDETGDFDRPGSAVSVVGWLAPQRALLADASLRAALEATAPHVPWPHHAYDLMTPGGHLAAWLTRHRSQRERTDPGGVLEAARQAVRVRSSALPAALRAATAWGDSGANVEQLQALLSEDGPGHAIHARVMTLAIDRLLEYPDALHARARLEGLVELCERRMRALLGGLEEQFGGSLLIAAHARGGAATGDRYLELVQTLLERAGAWLAAGAPTTSLLLSAESRTVHPPESIAVSLLPRHLDGCARRAVERLRANGGLPDRVELRANYVGTKRHAESYLAGLVIADWLAHRTGAVLRATKRLDVLTFDVRNLTKTELLAPASAERRLPLCTATGEAREAFLRSRAGLPIVAAWRAEPGWTGDQVAVWQAYFGGVNA